ncbi:cell division cycle 5-like protein, partial [Caerostris extrusa]
DMEVVKKLWSHGDISLEVYTSMGRMFGQKSSFNEAAPGFSRTSFEQKHLELNTFKTLQELEGLAITKRVESLTEEVNRQVEREKMLQKKYEELLFKKTKFEGELEVASSNA